MLPIRNSPELERMLDSVTGDFQGTYESDNGAMIPGSVLRSSNLSTRQGRIDIDYDVAQLACVVNHSGNVTVLGNVRGELNATHGRIQINGLVTPDAVISIQNNPPSRDHDHSRIIGDVLPGAEFHLSHSDIFFEGEFKGGTVSSQDGHVSIHNDMHDGELKVMKSAGSMSTRVAVIIKGSMRAGQIESNGEVRIKGDIYEGCRINCLDGKVICEGRIHPGAVVYSEGKQLLPAVASPLDQRIKALKVSHPQLSNLDRMNKAALELLDQLIRPGVTLDELQAMYSENETALNMISLRAKLSDLFKPEIWQHRPDEMQQAWEMLNVHDQKDVPDYYANLRQVKNDTMRHRIRGQDGASQGMGL